MKWFAAIVPPSAVALLVCACQAPSTDSVETADTNDESARLSVLTSGGFAAAYDILAPRFEQATGIELITAYGASAGAAPDSIPSRLSRGEAVDLIILSRASLDELASLGEVRPATRVDLVRSSVGMAVRSGAPKPDISSEQAFVAAVMAADSIGYSSGASGNYLSGVLFPRLGIWEQIQPKSKRIVGEPVASAVARGEVEMGFQQISEILPVVGADYVGPLPAGLQEVTTFSAGITERAVNVEGAQRLIEFLSSEEAAAAIAQTGLVPVVLE